MSASVVAAKTPFQVVMFGKNVLTVLYIIILIFDNVKFYLTRSTKKK